MTSDPCKTKKKGVDLHYEEQWQNYSEEDVVKRANNLSPVLDAIISGLDVSGLKILDLGCGPAVLPLRICDSLGAAGDIQIYGIDISIQALILGKEVVESKSLGNIIHLVKGDCETLPFKNNIFDAVISNATINLLPDKEKGFKEIARVSKGGASIVAGDCTAKESKKCCQQDDDKLWSACIAGAPTKMEFNNLAEAAGLEMIETIDLSKDVTSLVQNGLWNWPEFIRYEMHYHVFVMRKI